MSQIKITVILCIFLCMLTQSNVFGEEIYKDENGVWRNSPGPEVYKDKNGVFTDGKKGEIYRDGKGVLTNSSISQDIKNAGRAVGKGFESSTEATIRGLANFMAAPIQERWKKRGDELSRQIKREAAERERIKFEKTHISDLSSYERFDPATAGEIKSEWEYFDDPRD